MSGYLNAESVWKTRFSRHPGFGHFRGGCSCGLMFSITWGSLFTAVEEHSGLRPVSLSSYKLPVSTWDWSKALFWPGWNERGPWEAVNTFLSNEEQRRAALPCSVSPPRNGHKLDKGRVLGLLSRSWLARPGGFGGLPQLVDSNWS